LHARFFQSICTFLQSFHDHQRLKFECVSKPQDREKDGN
jgi:hypothetical protein